MSKTPIVITQYISPPDFAAKAADLKLHHGIALNGTAGTVSKLGVVASYTYDGTVLTVEITNWPMFSTADHVRSLLTSWLQS